MSLGISHRTEARLAAKAHELGLSIDAFLEKLMNDTGDVTAAAESIRSIQRTSKRSLN